MNISSNNQSVETIQLPEQKAFFKIPARFGHVPVAEEPLGYDHERRFEQHYPRIELPFQLVDTVETGDKNEIRSFTNILSYYSFILDVVILPHVVVKRNFPFIPLLFILPP